jgi:electron transport complex protein RnfB
VQLAAITGQPVVPLNPDHGPETPRTVAIIDEAWCIGCTLCIKACPVDAIVGSNKLMHTVIAPYCTGCELCIPVCPVDCIVLENVTGDATGWDAWSDSLAILAQQRYGASRARRRQETADNESLPDKAEAEVTVPAPHALAEQAATASALKRDMIAAAQARARALRRH